MYRSVYRISWLIHACTCQCECIVDWPISHAFASSHCFNNRKGAADFEAVAAKWAQLKAAYISQRDTLASDDDFEDLLIEGSKTKVSLMKSIKKVAKGKPVAKTWEPHSEEYAPSRVEFSDTFDSVNKATQDLPKLAQEIRATVELPKRQLPLIQEYRDLLSKADVIVNEAVVEVRANEWSTYMEAVEYVCLIYYYQCFVISCATLLLFAQLLYLHLLSLVFEHSNENVDKATRKKNPTRFHESVNHYKEIRSKVAPLVGAKKKGNCSIM